jgi:hypothetical protein
MGQAAQLQCTPLGPMPEFGSCAKNGVEEDKKFIFSKSSSCMGSGRRGVVRASEPIHDPLPPPPLICMLLCALATPCNNMQLRVEKKAHLQWFCAHMFNVRMSWLPSRNAHCLSQPHNTHLCARRRRPTHILITPHARGQHSNTHNAAGPNRLAHTHAITCSLPIQLVVATVRVYEERRKNVVERCAKQGDDYLAPPPTHTAHVHPSTSRSINRIVHCCSRPRLHSKTAVHLICTARMR